MVDTPTVSRPSAQEAFDACIERIYDWRLWDLAHQLKPEHCQFIESETSKSPFLDVRIELEERKLRFGCFTSGNVVVAVGLRQNYHAARIDNTYYFSGDPGGTCPLCKQEQTVYKRTDVSYDASIQNHLRCISCMDLPDDFVPSIAQSTEGI
jgi:hypothetical protein